MRQHERHRSPRGGSVAQLATPKTVRGQENINIAVAAAYHGENLHNLLVRDGLNAEQDSDTMSGAVLAMAEHSLMMESFKVALNFSWQGLAVHVVALWFIISTIAGQLSDGDGLAALWSVLSLEGQA